MTKSEAGRRGGIETSIRYGVESLRCPLCGRLPEKSEFHAKNGRVGGHKGAAKVHKLYSPEQYAAWGSLGGRGRTKEKR